MDRSNVLTLIGKSYTTDAIGQRVPVETKRQVFCNLRSVSRSEWLAGGQLGLRPELVATMFAPDYYGEEIAEISFDGITEAQYLQAPPNEQQLYEDTEKILIAGHDNPLIGSAVRYGIYRIYRDSDERLELYLERKTGVSNG